MPDVSCATVETPVSHHTPSPSGSVPRASAPVTAPRCIRRALAFRPRSSACQRPHPNPRRIQRRRRVPSEVLYGAQRRSNRPRSLRPGPSRPRPHGSDSITRPRSSLPFPGASHRPSRRRTVISRASHRGSLNAQLHSSLPSRHRSVVNVSCECHRSVRGRAMASATLRRPCTVYPHS